MTEKLYFTFVIVARNAGKHLPNAFADFLAQDFPRDQLEFLFVDSLSDDDSLALAKEFKTAHKDINFTILTNPNRILASGWNVALQHAKGNILLRLDAHARIPPDFIRLNTENILKGHFITGGTLATTLPQETWPRFVGLANSCKFGASSAPFRKTGNNAEREVKTLAYAAYRREILTRWADTTNSCPAPKILKCTGACAKPDINFTAYQQ
ncbi:MAG: glycosyltransferase [Elusimicrobiaceae bacterium]